MRNSPIRDKNHKIETKITKSSKIVKNRQKSENRDEKSEISEKSEITKIVENEVV